jgi:hypothetical protein
MTVALIARRAIAVSGKRTLENSASHSSTTNGAT